MNPFDFIKSRNPSDMIKSMAGYKDKLAGITGAKGMGFTHTNPAKTSFEDEEAKNLGSPDSAIKETK